MKTRTIRVNIRQEPELYEALMNALNSGAAYEGWYVMQYSENVNSQMQTIGTFLLRDADD